MKIEDLWYRFALSFFKNYKDRIPYFDIRYSLFEIRYSLFQSFFFDLTGRPMTSGCADPPPAEHLNTTGQDNHHITPAGRTKAGPSLSPSCRL
jgi:hypothetical protein